MNIYQISEKAREISLALETGELTPEMENELMINQNDLQSKATDYGYVIKSMEDDCEAIDNEIKRLKAIKDSKGKVVERMKYTILNALQIYQIESVKTPTIKIFVRRSESVEVDSMEQLDARYLNEKVTVTADKIAIKKAIKAGELVEGARILENFNLAIS